MQQEAQAQQQLQQQQMQQQQVTVQHSQQHQNHSPVAVSGHQVIHQHVQQHHQQEQMQPQTVIIQPHGGGSPQAVQIKEWINGQPGQMQTHRAIIQPNGPGNPQTITIIQNPSNQGSIIQQNSNQGRQQIIRHVQPQQHTQIQHIQRHEPHSQHRGGGNNHQQMKTIQRVQPHNLSHPQGTTITKPKKVKQIKDPNAPKRPHSAFLLYCADHRHELRQQFPGARIGDIAKKLGQGWANVDPPTKMHYENLSNEQKDRYKREKEAYKASFARPGTQISPYNSHNQGNNGPSGSGGPPSSQHGPSSVHSIGGGSQQMSVVANGPPSLSGDPGQSGSISSGGGVSVGHNQEIRQEIRVAPNTQIVEVGGDGKSHFTIVQDSHGQAVEERSHSEASGSYAQQGGSQIVQIAKSESGTYKQEVVQDVLNE